MTDPRDADVRVERASAGAAREHVPTGGGHESRDVRIRPIVVAFTSLLVAGAVVYVLMYVVLQAFTARELERSDAPNPLAASYARHAPPEPRLQVAPRDDLRRLREREDALLHGFAWVDREKGVARIPIERAKEIVATRGLSAADGVPQTGAGAAAVGAERAP